MSRDMKNSGISWIGRIPSVWNTDTIGSLYSQRNEKVSDKDFPPLSVTKMGVVPQLETAAKTDDGDNRKLVKKGDFAINSRSDRRGSCGISSLDGSVSLINTILTPRTEMNPRFYSWLFHTSEFADEFYKWGHGIVDDLWTTRWQEMKRIAIIVPPLDEQQAIANILDKKCGEIDEMVSLQERIIEELKAYKQSVITEAVCKGLDPNVPMKDSGLDWIGLIPAHWGTPCIGYLSSISSGGTPDRNVPSFWVNGTVNWFKTGELTNQSIFESEEKITEAAVQSSSAKLFPCKTILVAMYGQGKTRGMTALLETEGTTNQACAGIQVNNPTIMTEYLWKCIIGAYNALRELAIGTGQPNLNIEQISNFRIPLPPINEQKSIVQYIDRIVPVIDNLITLKLCKIDSLKDFRKSIIYEYVTGKKEVQ